MVNGEMVQTQGSPAVSWNKRAALGRFLLTGNGRGPQAAEKNSLGATAGLSSSPDTLLDEPAVAPYRFEAGAGGGEAGVAGVAAAAGGGAKWKTKTACIRAGVVFIAR